MAYMKLNTFDIYHEISSEEELNTDGFAEIDDLIAPIVSILNKKGYITTNSCSGHPYFDYQLSSSVIEENLLNSTIKDEFNKHPYISGYIMFSDNIFIHSHPSDDSSYMEMDTFTNKPRFIIRYWYEFDNDTILNPYKVYDKIFDIMKNWMEWAESLPNYSIVNAISSMLDYAKSQYLCDANALASLNLLLDV
jgi:hypothetical protein